MGFLYNGNGIIGALSTILTFAVVAVLFFALASVLVNILAFALPIAIVFWLVYKGIKMIKLGSIKYTKEKSSEIFEAEVMSSEKHFEEAILNNRVIDVDYTEA